MPGKRTRYAAEFKARVALEALRGEVTTAQLAAKHGIHQPRVGEPRRFHQSRFRPSGVRAAPARRRGGPG